MNLLNYKLMALICKLQQLVKLKAITNFSSLVPSINEYIITNDNVRKAKVSNIGFVIEVMIFTNTLNFSVSLRKKTYFF